MTTDADTDNQIDAAEVWRTIGRLEGDVAALLEGQRELRTDLKAGLEETNRRMDEGLRETRAGLEETNRRLDEGLREIRAGLEATNRRVDRVFYAILAVGGALLVAVFVNRIIGG